MSENKVIPPWKKGSTVVQDAKPKTQREHMQSIAQSGGQATARNRILRAQGFKVKSAYELKHEKRNLPKKPGTPGTPDPNSRTSIKVGKYTDEYISDQMRKRADAFVLEYIKDFNCINAWLRIGGNPNTPTSAREMLRWPYVQQKLAEIAESEDIDKLVTAGQIVLGLKKEANDFSEESSHSARVSAWGKLSRIKRLDVQKVESTVEHRGGVMVLPAAAPSMDDWEAGTIDGQAQLKHEVTK